jgi:hypothetical protein
MKNAMRWLGNTHSWTATPDNTTHPRVSNVARGSGRRYGGGGPSYSENFAPPEAFSPTKLRQLSLVGIRLSLIVEYMQTWLDLASLQSLKIENCRNVKGFFFTMLKHIFRNRNKVALVRLTVLQQIKSSCWVAALAQFLGSFKGLTTLFVSSPSIECLSVPSIGNHGKTLQHLHVDFLNDEEGEDLLEYADQLYTIPELSQLASDCPHIEELALSLLVLDMDSGMHVPKNFSVANGSHTLDQELINALVRTAWFDGIW